MSLTSNAQQLEQSPVLEPIFNYCIGSVKRKAKIVTDLLLNIDYMYFS